MELLFNSVYLCGGAACVIEVGWHSVPLYPEELCAYPHQAVKIFFKMGGSQVENPPTHTTNLPALLKNNSFSVIGSKFMTSLKIFLKCILLLLKACFLECYFYF